MNTSYRSKVMTELRTALIVFPLVSVIQTQLNEIRSLYTGISAGAVNYGELTDTVKNKNISVYIYDSSESSIECAALRLN